jgi:lysozyme
MRRILIWSGVAASVALIFAAVLADLYVKGAYRFSYPDAVTYPVRGIDISHHQGEIDWKRIAGQNIRFAWLKASEGGDWTDPTFAHHLAEARAAGIAVGAYHYFTLCASGAEQAANFLRAVPEKLDLPPAIDLEYVGNCAGRPPKGKLTHEVQVFIADISAQHRVTPVLYTGENFYDDYLANDPKLAVYPLWVRNLYGETAWSHDHPVLFRQFASHARLAGISGPVDLDLFIGTKRQFAELLAHPP